MHANEFNGWLITWGNANLPEVTPAKSTRWHQGLAPMFDEAKNAFGVNYSWQAQFNGQVLKQIWNPLASPSIPSELGFGPGSVGAGTAAPNGFYITYAVSPFLGLASDPIVERPIVRMVNVEEPGKSIYLVTGRAAISGGAAAEDIEDEGFPKITSNNVYFPHRGHANAIFVDGHVEAFEGMIPARYFRISE